MKNKQTNDLVSIKKKIDTNNRQLIRQAIKQAVKQYKDTFIMLGKEGKK